MKKVSCIICAFNEETRIGAVLDIVHNHPLLNEVIVVNDGSTDQTKSAVLNYPSIIYKEIEINKGKSNALAQGVSNAKNEILLFLDADIKGLKQEDVTNLIEPVLSSDADVSMTLRHNSLMIYKLIGLDFVSGERVFSRTLINNVIEDIKKLPGYGVEVFLNRLIIKNKLKIKVINWKDVSVTPKAEKIGFLKGSLAELKMVFQILKVISLWELVSQNVIMHYLASNRFEKSKLPQADQ